jgi:hypothetical protein
MVRPLAGVLKKPAWGTGVVLLVDLLATLGVVVFAALYSKFSLWVFAPVLLVTLVLSLLIAGLVVLSNRRSLAD